MPRAERMKESIRRLVTVGSIDPEGSGGSVGLRYNCLVDNPVH
jgi:hypothetical protein